MLLWDLSICLFCLNIFIWMDILLNVNLCNNHLKSRSWCHDKCGTFCIDATSISYNQLPLYWLGLEILILRSDWFNGKHMIVARICCKILCWLSMLIRTLFYIYADLKFSLMETFTLKFVTHGDCRDWPQANGKQETLSHLFLWDLGGVLFLP